MTPNLIVNPGKKEFVEYQGRRFASYAIPTPLVTPADRLEDLAEKFVRPLIKPGDVLFLSEKMVACTQGRARRVEEIRPGFLARFLSRFVQKSARGIGLAMPETMQCALDECGAWRILLAAAAGAIGKLLRREGWFYHVAGYKAAAVDGPCRYTLPPYNRYVVPAPSRPNWTAVQISRFLGGIPVFIVDLNDIGGRILGASHRKADRKLYLELLRQNPLGQSCEQTPMGILRPINEKN